MGHVRYTRRAREDLLDIWAYIAADNPTAADRVYDRIDTNAGCCVITLNLDPAGPTLLKVHACLLSDVGSRSTD